MKVVTKTKVEEVVDYYEAIDGTRFNSKEECMKYENTAKVVLYGMVKEKILAVSNEYDFFCKVGLDDWKIEVYNIDSISTVELVNRYFYSKTYDEDNKITENMMGKQIVVEWNYDEDCVRVLGTIDEICESLKQSYFALLNKD